MTSRVGASELAKTEKLNGTNFYQWKRRIMLALTLKRLIYVLEKPYLILPDRPSDDQIKELDNYRVDDLMAKTIMLAYMEDDLIQFFEDYKTTKEMFEAIKARYDVNTAAHVQVLLQQYSTLKMKESDSVTDHVNKMLVMAKDLLVLNNPIADAMQINTILNSLPPSWKMTVVALKTQFGNLNIDQLPLQLKALEEDIKVDKSHELMMTQDKSSSYSFPSRPRQFKKKFNNFKSKKNPSFHKHPANTVKCFKCGKIGHIQRNCRTKIYNNNTNNRKPRPDNQDKEVICVVTECHFANEDLSGWWVHSGAT
ncbi:unnamed protein product [Victoria cruziana]